MFRSLAMISGEGASRRLKVLASNLLGSGRAGRHDTGRSVRFFTTSSDGKVVSIGDVSMKLITPSNPELVPVKYLPEKIPQNTLQQLRWIMQKDVLGQDVFLLGAPGPLRRSLAMMYLELTQKEAEYVSLSRDTTESDLKQRREIRGGTAFHIDQCAVRAATQGRVLVLEGIEKAERNVLPVLNNLLENREMQLDDGRFLMAPSRYDKLLSEHSQDELDAWNLVRVDEKFRVIALGLPVPRYQGNPLDPPLRSRFQAKDVTALPFQDHMKSFMAQHGSQNDRVHQLLSFASTMRSDEAHGLGLPDFPLDNLHAVISILNNVPSNQTEALVQRLYPYSVMLNKEGRDSVKDALKSFELLGGSESSVGGLIITEVRRNPEGASVQLQSTNGASHSIKVPAGSLDTVKLGSGGRDRFVSTQYHDQLLADIIQSHSVKDFCLIGPRGCGKSVLMKEFADLLGYHTEHIMLYQDMTSRDLLQQRTTLPNGDTVWRHSPLVTAALEGSLAILDGIHRVNAGTFAVLHRLIHDRELSLFDGTRLLSHDRYDAVKNEYSLTDEDMIQRGIMRIHPSFRIAGLAEPPVLGSSSGQWLNSELLTMFLYHHMRDLTQQEEHAILSKLVPDLSHMQPILDLTHKLRDASDANMKSTAASLSTRQLLRIARRLALYPDENLHDTIQKACLSKFLPRLTKTALEEELDSVGLKPSATPSGVDGMERAVTCEIRDGVLRIGNTQVDVFNPDTKMKVPDVLFYENPQHLAVMEDMLKNYLLGEHLLLVGNQGVGKNKIADRFLHLLNRPREYLQLHRDTTVQTLTLQPTVIDGVIQYEDSPLVRAVRNGLILVVDEADKAPTHVTCILKTLVESGEMHLADGRRIVSADSGLKPSEQIIVAHPDFKMFVLANRPGFPFLGNDFFGAMGDIFSCHAIDNPDPESEMSMLRQYGPNVPDDILRKLVQAFGELRDLADQGMITYPYSTREVVNMVRHLEKFPKEGLANVVQNVFDFDMYNKELTETVVETLHKHGIPIGANPNNVALAKEFPLPEPVLLGQWRIHQADRKHTGLFHCPVEERQVRIKGPVQMPVQSHALDKTEARSLRFTEQEAFWTLPLHETSAIVDVAVTKGAMRQPARYNEDIIHIATINPITLYTMNASKQHLTYIDLYDVFPSAGRRSVSNKPRIHIAPLGFPLDNTVVLHEEISNITLSVNWETGELSRIETGSLVEAAADKLTRNLRQQQGVFKMCSDFSHEPDGFVLMYKQDSDYIEMLNMLEGRCYGLSLPVKINNIMMASRYDWLITEAETNRKYLVTHTKETPMDFILRGITESSNHNSSGDDEHAGVLDLVAPVALPDSHLSAVLSQQIQSPNRVLSDSHSLATIAVGLPDLSDVELFSVQRPDLEKAEDNRDMSEKFSSYMSPRSSRLRSKPQIAYLPDSGQVVRAVPSWKVPRDVFPDGVKPRNISAYLEVVDLVNKQMRYIPVPGVTNQNVYNQWYYAGSTSSEAGIVMGTMSHDGLVTVDNGGCVRLWQTALYYLDQSLKQWRRLIGQGQDGELKVDYLNEREFGKQPDQFDPKFGKIDPSGAPHVGGGMWAGGSGGMNTAGMGGIGGPYRLDVGQEVHQIPDWEKQAIQVPEEVKRAAREMAQKAFKERLKQIQMSEFDAELYERYAADVRHQTKSLRVIMESLQAKGKERQWLKHQTHGDFDDAKLIEGLTGERAIYKRRGEKEPELGSPQQKPKLVRLLCDVSGSMYRFNGYDNRLEREMEAMLMVMEALEGYEQKVKYEIIGHSGEGYKFDIVKGDKPPKNNKARLDVIKTLHAHAQFCISGDHTLEAAKHAIKTITNEEADEHFVIVLSDANLDRYGIRPKHFAEILTSNEDVNAYVIFIGSLGDQANRIIKQMPAGRAFLCMDTKNLPQILQQIFTSTMLSSL